MRGKEFIYLPRHATIRKEEYTTTIFHWWSVPVRHKELPIYGLLPGFDHCSFSHHSIHAFAPFQVPSPQSPTRLIANATAVSPVLTNWLSLKPSIALLTSS